MRAQYLFVILILVISHVGLAIEHEHRDEMGRLIFSWDPEEWLKQQNQSENQKESQIITADDLVFSMTIEPQTLKLSQVEYGQLRGVSFITRAMGHSLVYSGFEDVLSHTELVEIQEEGDSLRRQVINRWYFFNSILRQFSKTSSKVWNTELNQRVDQHYTNWIKTLESPARGLSRELLIEAIIAERSFFEMMGLELSARQQAYHSELRQLRWSLRHENFTSGQSRGFFEVLQFSIRTLLSVPNSKYNSDSWVVEKSYSDLLFESSWYGPFLEFLKSEIQQEYKDMESQIWYSMTKHKNTLSRINKTMEGLSSLPVPTMAVGYNVRQHLFESDSVEVELLQELQYQKMILLEVQKIIDQHLLDTGDETPKKQIKNNSDKKNKCLSLF
jgi:hypothetical protein